MEFSQGGNADYAFSDDHHNVVWLRVDIADLIIDRPSIRLIIYTS